MTQYQTTKASQKTEAPLHSSKAASEKWESAGLITMKHIFTTIEHPSGRRLLELGYQSVAKIQHSPEMLVMQRSVY